MVGFEVAFARRQATQVFAVPGGIAVRHAEFPLSQNNNRLIIKEAADPDAVLRAADTVLAGLEHRLVTVYDDGLGKGFVAPMLAAGYQHVPLLAMSFSGDVPPAPVVRVEAVDPGTLIPSLRHEWRAILPNGSQDRINQLAERVAARLKGADEVQFLAVVDDVRRVLARVDLYIQDGIAQIEFVATAPEHRGHGYARAVVHEALRRAHSARCGLVFLLAEELDWPSAWYGRLGFTRIGRVHEFTRESDR
jgi:ribosomal protein S18 acetylase RimI-like enzyme